VLRSGQSGSTQVKFAASSRLPRAGPASRPGIRAKRTGTHYLAIYHARRHDMIWSNSPFYPLDQWTERVELVCTGASTTVAHARQQKQANASMNAFAETCELLHIRPP